MALPNEIELADGLLKALHQIGRPASVDEQRREVARYFNLTEEDTSEIHQKTRTKFVYKTDWARTYLKNAELIRNTDRGVWELTDQGKKFPSIYDFRDSVGGERFDDLFDSSEDDGIEGVDTTPPESFGEYPIESVLVRQETRTIFEIIRRINEKKFILDPDFQRDFLWPLDKQSKLIESVLMRIPLPVFYLAEREDGKTIVVDGLQRLTTMKRFLGGEFSLSNLDVAKELNGKKFSDLPPKLQNRMEDTPLILFLLDSKAPEQAKLDIFDRVNGGVPLTRQQMRNSIYNGPATRWLKNEVESDVFLKATGRSLDRRTMRDRECVNRFCAFEILGVDSYSRGDMDSFLALALKEMNRFPENRLLDLSVNFRRSMQNNHKVFGAHSFRKHTALSSKRSVINVALFDVFSVMLSKLTLTDELSIKVKDAFFSLMDEPRFVDAISLGTNATAKVKLRFEMAATKLNGLFDVYGN